MEPSNANLMREPTCRRARRDSESLLASLWSKVLGVVGSAASAFFAFFVLRPSDASDAENFAYPLGGVVVAALVPLALIYLTNLFLSPYRQRDEAWAKLEAMPGSQASPIKPEPQLFINFPSDEPKPQSAGKDLPIPVSLGATNHMIVEQMDLEIAGKTAPSSWTSDQVDPGVAYDVTVHFTLPPGINAGEKTVKIVAKANNKEWESEFIAVLIAPQSHDAQQVQLAPE